ncbi:MAG TPA: SUMF1/EgtB/PvdO family nonheme iron enzyme, partial [Anaerolineae bacterium]|nr:SUMF1/EgtB/PvdO family nonheme iron enzyme [Anaerolineae bacterium]
MSTGDGMAQRCVPAGAFVMGAVEEDRAADADEKPAHEVWLDAFWIDETEITNLQFARCVAAGACQRQVEAAHSQTRPSYYGNPEYDDYPVLIYYAEDAEAYCRWAGRRLPTEAEWEKAARGTDARTFPWGEELGCARASHAGCDADTSPAGSRLDGASAYGALDMAGNVWEWVSDWYDAEFYARSPRRNPQGPERGQEHVARGGGWKGLPEHLRTTQRAEGISHWFDGQIGFRCAVSAPIESARSWPAASWAVSSPEAQGMDPGILAEMVEFVEREEVPIDAIFVTRHGYVVLEVYFAPYRAGQQHEIYS